MGDRGGDSILFLDGAMLGLALSGIGIGGWFVDVLLSVLSSGLMYVALTQAGREESR